MNLQPSLLERCRELQSIEVKTLISIYSHSVSILPVHPSQNHHPSDHHHPISISIQIDLIKPRRIRYRSHPFIPSSDQTLPRSTESPASPTVQLRYLPPFQLHVEFPPGYPIRVPPKLDIQCKWATPSDLLRACNEIARIWKYGSPVEDLSIDGEGCIGLCVDWLEHDWIDPYANHQQQPVKLLIPLSSSQDPQSSLDRYLNHDRNLAREEFLNLDFQCPICLEIEKGRQCIQLEGCGHVFCQDCLKDFFSLMVREGTIDKVRCCHEACKGRRTEVEHPNGEDQSILSDELLGLVGPVLKLRYDELFEKQAIESDPTLSYCPMDSCRSLVRPDDTFDGSKSENLRVCSKCGYSFCFMCRKTWHGPTNQCMVPYLEQMIEEYLNESSIHKRERMEKRLGGPERMRRLVRDYEENRANQDWKMAHTNVCVNCFVPVEKIEGCS